MELQKFTVELPAIVEQSKATADAATEMCSTVITKAQAVDWSKMTNDQLKASDEKLSALQGRCAAAEEKMRATRMPITEAFEQFKKENFIANEKVVESYKFELKKLRIAVANETQCRIDEANRAKNIALAEQQAAIEAKAAFDLHIQMCAWKLISATRISVTTKFYNTADLDLFAKNLDAWVPSQAITDDTIKAWEKQYITDDTIGDHDYHADKAAIRAMIDEVLIPYKQATLEDIPGRKAQLAAGVSTAADEAIATLKVQVLQDAEEQMEAATTASTALAEAEKINTVFELEANNTAPEQAKGTRIKKVYAPVGHGHWQLLITWYVANQFPHLTIPELEKKFGWILTKANGVLNATQEKIVGIPVENDMSVSARKSK